MKTTSEISLILEATGKLVKYMGHTILQSVINEEDNYIRVKTADEKEFFIVVHYGNKGPVVGLTRLMSIVDDDKELAPLTVDGFRFVGSSKITDNCLHELQINPYKEGFTLWAYHHLETLTDSCIRETLDRIFSGGFNIQ